MPTRIPVANVLRTAEYAIQTKGTMMSMHSEARTEPMPPRAPNGGRVRQVAVGALILVAAGLLYLAGTLPRVRRQAVLAADVQQVRTAVPAVSVVTPRRAA